MANCCNACKHVNRPKKPTDHEAHYMVAKTERWCYKYNIPTMREAYCEEGFELETKKGASAAFKRILSQNRKLNKIIEIKNYMIENNIDELIGLRCGKPHYSFIIMKDKIQYKYIDTTLIYNYHVVSFKETSPYEELVEAYERIN